jgi:hypothetical protein
MAGGLPARLLIDTKGWPRDGLIRHLRSVQPKSENIERHIQGEAARLRLLLKGLGEIIVAPDEGGRKSLEDCN